MALVKCKACGHDVSSDAKACPRCGKPRQAFSGPAMALMIGFALFMLCGLGGLVTGGSSSDRRAAAPAGTATSTPSSEPTASVPVMSVKIPELLAAYKNNEVAADAKYKGKIVEVVGYADDIKKDILGSIYVTLGTGARFEIPQVQAFVAKSEVDKAAGLNKGDVVGIRGRVEGLMMNVLVRDALIIGSKKPQP